MKPREPQRQGLKFSLILHAMVLVSVLVWPLFFRACNRHRPNEQLTFVDFTVSLPPPPAEEVPEPPQPVPEEIKVPDAQAVPEVKKPEPPKPPKDIRQTNRVVRKGPPPKDKPLSAAEIERLLKMGARISDTTSIPDEGQISLAAYFNQVHDRMYSVWQQPSALSSLPGLSTDVRITVEPGGRITGRSLVRGSGNELMDSSVMKAVHSVTALPPLPVGHRRPVDITITFEIGN